MNDLNPSTATSFYPANSYTEQVQKIAAALEPYLIEKRRFFHAHPELSGKEVNTTAAIAEELDAIGVEYAYLPDFEPGPASLAYNQSPELDRMKQASVQVLNNSETAMISV